MSTYGPIAQAEATDSGQCWDRGGAVGGSIAWRRIESLFQFQSAAVTPAKHDAVGWTMATSDVHMAPQSATITFAGAQPLQPWSLLPAVAADGAHGPMGQADRREGSLRC
jgi:hypothetical protein